MDLPPATVTETVTDEKLKELYNTYITIDASRVGEKTAALAAHDAAKDTWMSQSPDVNTEERYNKLITSSMGGSRRRKHRKSSRKSRKMRKSSRTMGGRRRKLRKSSK